MWLGTRRDEGMTAAEHVLEDLGVTLDQGSIEETPLAAGGGGQIYRGTFAGEVVAVKAFYSQVLYGARTLPFRCPSSVVGQTEGRSVVLNFALAVYCR